MARKTFISYKYSEAKDLRDKIVESLGEDAKYYQGETSDSPNMKESNWIDWEIEYSVKQMKRGDRTSGTNGVVGVVMKHNGDYSWLRTSITNSDGHTGIRTDNSYLYDIIVKNRFNQEPAEYTCDECQNVDVLTGSFISLVEEDEFLSNPTKYIENAYEKSKKTSNYNICRRK
ncbi:TIR domain-containing protein [Bacillus altitudinis]|uniref:TIR domain-containing protein n=1 Tax=Bacillus altitudinis TaxID=293387 RepID=UPI003D0267DA